MFPIKLPFWMNKGELAKIAILFEKWWFWVMNILRYPFETQDEEKCSERILSLIAYQRDITRFKDEPLELFRKRVKYAFINAKDAGSVAGFKRIFERLGIGYVEIEERFDKENWDVIKIRVNDSQISKNPDLLNLIIRHYGRTCRRYTFEVIINQNIQTNYGEFNQDYQCFPIKLNI
ncbi:phage tail protein [[Actinobacillus] muris]|uniref:Phage tail protein n=1 Tax=Muribacter muris TaxID=67855 RepID=A0A0J5P6S4_9PAST|nr:phage tail protein [Muribacter muris]KMK51465.1 phage tail protein [[Actinobacillus] muris] [Muribacter muris]